MLILTDEQNKAKNKFLNWFKNWNVSSKPYFFISGFAGTGKTTLLKFILDELNVPFQICTFTGKAAVNVKKKTGYPCKTIHSLLYTPIIEEGRIIDWELNLFNQYIERSKLIIIDEISMVDKDIWTDLLKFCKPILVFGDLGQLPPVHGQPIFNNDNVDYVLNQIHRQALENPIIRLSVDVRNQCDIKYGNYNNQVLKISKKDFLMDNLNKFEQVICGTNRTRNSANRYIREMLGFGDTIYPNDGEKIICLQNNRDMKVFNGQMFISGGQAFNINEIKGTFNTYLKEEENDRFRAEIFVDEFLINKDIREDRWKIQKNYPKIMQACYGYCITCHKSQGSEWNNVCVFDESDCFREDKWKWLYTAITRSKNKLVILK